MSNKQVAQQRVLYLQVEGVSCAACIPTVKSALETSLSEFAEAVSGFSYEAPVVKAEGWTRVCCQFPQDNDACVAALQAKLKQAVEAVGYTAAQGAAFMPLAAPSCRWWRAVLPGVAALLLWAFEVAGYALTGPWAYVVGGLSAGFLLACGGDYFRRAGRLDMNTLVALGTAGAWVISMWALLWPGSLRLGGVPVSFAAALMILAIVNLGKAVQLRGRRRLLVEEASQRAQLQVLLPDQGLLRLALDQQDDFMELAKQATGSAALSGFTEKLASVSRAQFKEGEVCFVPAGTIFPVDGWLLGHADVAVQAQLFTGTVQPVLKQARGLARGAVNAVQAGMRNVSTEGVWLQAKTAGEQTALHQILKALDSPSARQAALTAGLRWFMLVVMVWAVVAAVFWAGFASVSAGLTVLLSVLLCACPCVFGLAIPLSYEVAASAAYARDIWVKQPDALAKMPACRLWVFDKTGTLTQGQPTLNQDDSWLAESMTWQAGLDLAGRLEQFAAYHPLAQPFLRAANDAPLLRSAERVEVGERGIQGVLDGQMTWLGSPAFVEQAWQAAGGKLADPIWRSATLHSEAITQSGAMSVWLMQRPVAGGTPRLQAVWALHDRQHDAVIDTLTLLKAQGHRLALLTGDNETTTAHFVRNLHKTAGQRIFADEDVQAACLPDDKLAWVATRQAEGHLVGFCGDGFNDTRALQQADVGVAVGAAGLAASQADVQLAKGLGAFLPVMTIAQKTQRHINQNLGWAVGLNMVNLLAASGVFYAWTGHLLSPVLASVLMGVSSLLILANVWRLRRQLCQMAQAQRSPVVLAKPSILPERAPQSDWGVSLGRVFCMMGLLLWCFSVCCAYCCHLSVAKMWLAVLAGQMPSLCILTSYLGMAFLLLGGGLVCSVRWRQRYLNQHSAEERQLAHAQRGAPAALKATDKVLSYANATPQQATTLNAGQACRRAASNSRDKFQ